MNQISKGEKFSTLGLQASLFLIALSAPISIAATQTAWSLALLFWLIRLIFVRPTFRPEGFDIALIAFVGLTLISSIFSYEQEVSLRKMVPVSLVTIVYLVSEYTTTRRQLHRLVTILLISCFASCIYTFATLAVGKNLKVQSLSANGPLNQAGVETGDTILKANGINISSPEDLYAAISQHSIEGSSSITVYRHEFIKTFALNSAGLTLNDLGIHAWSRGRDTRATGFYGHYVTFAEVLQLIASLALGLFIALKAKSLSRNRILLTTALAAYGLALFLTITRASWLSFLISAAVMIFIGASRRTILICATIAIPLAVGGLFFLQHKRQVGFFDAADGSTSWRLTVWREGLDLLMSEPRHLAVGVGMDSLKTHYLDWKMFDNGRQPIGHLHNDYLQIAFERGVPTLIAWIIWMFIYLRMLWRKLRENNLEWLERGILLGSFGGTIGFLTSGLVHYNLGDSENAMVLYLMMGLSLAVMQQKFDHVET